MSRPVTGRHQPHPENVCAPGRRRACGLSYSQYHAQPMDTRLHGYDKLPPLRLSGFARDPLSSLTPSGGGWLMFMNYVKIFQPGALSPGYGPPK